MTDKPAQKATKQTTKVAASKKISKDRRLTRAPVRLWVKAVFTGFRRSKVNQYEKQALLKIQGVNDSTTASWYWGKRVAFIYKAHSTVKNTKYRTIWGRISKSHGNNGVVIARFRNNLPPKSMGAIVRILKHMNAKAAFIHIFA